MNREVYFFSRAGVGYRGKGGSYRVQTVRNVGDGISLKTSGELEEAKSYYGGSEMEEEVV